MTLYFSVPFHRRVLTSCLSSKMHYDRKQIYQKIQWYNYVFPPIYVTSLFNFVQRSLLRPNPKFTFVKLSYLLFINQIQRLSIQVHQMSLEFFFAATDRYCNTNLNCNWWKRVAKAQFEWQGFKFDRPKTKFKRAFTHSWGETENTIWLRGDRKWVGKAKLDGSIIECRIYIKYFKMTWGHYE